MTSFLKGLIPPNPATATGLRLAAAFFASHALSLLLIRLSGPLAPAWPPIGVALAALIILPRDHRPLIYLSIAILDTLSNALQGFLTIPAVAYLGVTYFELFIADRLLQRLFREPLRFARVADVILFVAVISIASAVSAGPASVIGYLTNGTDMLSAAMVWWIGDMLGYILVVPLAVLLAFPPAAQPRGPLPLRIAEAGLIALAMLVGGLWAFQGHTLVEPLDAHPYMLTVPILWATLRYGQLGTLWCVLGAGVVGVGLLMADMPLSLGGDTRSEALILLQVFLGVVSVSSLVLATALRAHQDATVANAQMIVALTESEQRLRQSQKMEAIGQLAGGVAHDFNNVLAAILMQLGEIRLVRDLPRTASELLGDVENAAQRAARLTRQLLVFSRQQAMQPRVLDLNGLVRNYTRLLRRVVPTTHALSVSLNPEPLVVAADEGMIEQVLLNLVLNARDAQRDGGSISITTSARTAAEEGGDALTGDFAVITVSDTGIGIPEEHMPRLFEPFFTTKPPGHGTGLGLATAYGIVEQHGGTIRVDSHEGVGTTVEVWLPISRAPLVSDDTNSETFEPHSGEHATPHTILVVEDEPTVRRLMARVLERDGFRVRTAASGREALDNWSDYVGVVDLVLTDVVMPGGVSGTQLGRELLNRHPHLPIVYTSGYDPDYNPSDVTMVPGENFVPKPATAEQLLAVVRKKLVGPGRT